MESVSIFIAPPSQRDILAALVDLSQIGVLSPFGWIEAPVNPEGAPDSEDPHLVWTVCGRMVVSTLATEIHSDEIERLRVIVLVPVGTDGDSLSDEAETFYQELNVLEVKDLTCDRIRVMVPRSKESVTPLQARAGWHNIMLSPEGASGPRFPGVPWWNDETTIPGLAAVSLAAMGGIIEGVDSAPLDHETIDASEMVRVVKSYVRMVDAKGIEDQLRQQILTVTDHFPSPMLPSKKTIDAFSDPLRESSRAANEWAKLHEAKLRRPLNTPQDVQRTQIGLLSALRQLLSFLWVSIKGAPRAWVNGKIRDLKTLTSSAATGLIFGVDSRMSVVVGGIGPDGNPSNWREMVNVAKETASEWSALPGQDHKADRRSTSAMWTTLVEGGNALLDGSGCQPLNLPAEIGYVPDRRDVAPSERDRQGVFVLDKSFGTLPAGSKFRAWDALRIQDALRVLEQVFKEGGVKASDAAVEGKRLMAWHDSNELRYLPRIGRYFRHWFDATRQEIMKDRAALEALSGEDIEEEGHRFAKSARIMKILTIVALAAVGLLVILGVFAVLGWAAVGLLAGLTTVAWIVASIIQYLRSARDFFGLMHRAQLERNTRAEIEERLRVRLDDLAALGQAYAQYEQWAEVYTEFLSDPLGQKNAAHVGGFWQASTPKNMELRMLRG